MKFHSMPLPECNLPATEILFSEAPMGYHISCKNNKENSSRSDSKKNMSGKKIGNKTYPLKER